MVQAMGIDALGEQLVAGSIFRTEQPTAQEVDQKDQSKVEPLRLRRWSLRDSCDCVRIGRERGQEE